MIKQKLQSAWNWTKEKAKKFKKWIIALLIPVVLAAPLLIPNGIPEEYRMRANMDKVVHHKILSINDGGEELVEYFYISDNELNPNDFYFGTNRSFSSGRYLKRGVRVSGGKETVIAFTGEKVYRGEDGKVLKILSAKTTLKNWKKEKANSLIKRLFTEEVFATTDTYTSDDTWTCPAGVSSIEIDAWAAGGGGGGSGATRGGGGGGGAYSYDNAIAVTASSEYTTTVGQGGAGGSGIGGTNGVVGEDSQFIGDSAEEVLAKGGGGGGGNGGAAGSGGAAASGIGTTKYSGGNGDVDASDGGGGGGGAGDSGNGGAASGASGGAGGTSDGGAGGNGGVNSVGAAGSTLGGGAGGGDYGYYGGGTGARGEMRLTYTAVGENWLSGWAKRVKATVSNTNIDANVTHFPLLLTLGTSVGTGNDDISFIFDELTADANRKKIAVTKDDGTTEIYVEIEKWDDGNEDAWVWVSKSDLTLTSGATTVLYFYYDSSQSENTTYVDDTNTGNSHNVWDSNFENIQHMVDDGGGEVDDSTNNSNDGTKKGAGEPNEVSGHIGNAQDFDGSDDEITCGTGATLDCTSAITLEALTNRDSIGRDAIAGMWDYGGDALQYYLEFYVSDYPAFFVGYNSGASFAYALSDTAVTDLADYHYIVGKWDKTDDSGNITVFVDGAEVSYTTQNTHTDDISTGEATDFFIGERQDAYPQPLEGIIDEVRLSCTLRTDDWIKTTWYGHNDNLVSWGSEETAPSGRRTIIWPQ